MSDNVVKKVFLDLSSQLVIKADSHTWVEFGKLNKNKVSQEHE